MGLNLSAFVAAKFLASLFVAALMPLVFVLVYNAALRLASVSPALRPARGPHPHLDANFATTPVWRGVYLPRSVGTAGGAVQLYWMLVVNSFAASAHAVLISLLVDPDKAMLAAVLMLVFMNLAATVHPR